MSKQHTPYRFDHEWFQIVDSKNNVIADYVNEDKAELILKAINNHDRLVEALYEANNQARRLLNRHDPHNTTEMKKVNDRAKYLAENFGNNDNPKIIQS